MPDIGDLVGEVAQEFSKLGKSVTSQITGSSPAAPSKTDDFSVKDQAKGFGKSLTAQLFGIAIAPKRQNLNKQSRLL